MPAFSRFKRDPSIGAEEVVKKEKMGEKWKKLGKFGKKDKDTNKKFTIGIPSGEISSPSSSPPLESILKRTDSECPQEVKPINPLEYYTTPIRNDSDLSQATAETPPLHHSDSMASSFGTILQTPAQSSHSSPIKGYFPDIGSGDKQASFGLGINGLPKVTFHQPQIKVGKDQPVQRGTDRLANFGNCRLKTFGEDGKWAIGPSLDEDSDRIEGRRENGIYDQELNVYGMMVQLVKTGAMAKLAAEDAYMRKLHISWGIGSYDEFEQVVDNVKSYLATICLFLHSLDDIAVIEGSMSIATLECRIPEIVDNTDAGVVSEKAGETVRDQVGEEFMRNAFVPWKYSEEPAIVRVQPTKDIVNVNTAITAIGQSVEKYLSTLYFFLLHQIQSIASHINPMFSMRPEMMARAIIRVKTPKPIPHMDVDEDGMVTYRGAIYPYIEHAMDAAGKELDLLASEWAMLDYEIESSIEGNETWFGVKDVRAMMDDRVKAFDKVKRECNLAIC